MKFESVGYISNLSPNYAYTVDSSHMINTYDSEALADDDLLYIDENAGVNDSVQNLSVTSAKVYAFQPILKEDIKAVEGIAKIGAQLEVEQTESAIENTQTGVPNENNPVAEDAATGDDDNNSKLGKDERVHVDTDDIVTDDDYYVYEDQDDVDAQEDDYEFQDYVEIDEPSDREEIIREVAGKQKLTRSERAHQMAVDIIAKYDWSRAHLPLLHEIFIEKGWAMARVSIVREMNKGLTPDELKIAFYIRQLWTESTHYWISFIHVTNNAMHQQTRDAYKNMSWPEALRIIRTFNNTPSEEEVQSLLEALYDDWYGSVKKQREFKTFIRYVKYHTGSVKGTLAGKELFTFKEDCEQYFNLEPIEAYYNVNNNNKFDYIDLDQILIHCYPQIGGY